jgi:hypothetical protein
MMDGWPAFPGIDVVELLHRLGENLLLVLRGATRRRLGHGSGINPRRVQHVEPTYCHESCLLQAAWGAMDLAVQKSSPLQVVDVG